MKKCLAFLAVAVLVACFCVFPVSAQGSQDVLVSRTEDVLDNGDSVVIELYESAAQLRTGKNGYKTLLNVGYTMIVFYRRVALH